MNSLTVEQALQQLRALFDKYSDVHLKARSDDWKTSEYVSPLAVRGQMVVLQAQEKEAFIVPTVNYLAQQWQATKAPLTVQGRDGKLYTIESIAVESKAFSGVETCVVLNVASILA